MSITSKDFSVVSGDTFTAEFLLKDNSGTIFNLTGYTPLMQLRSSTGALGLELSLGAGLVLDAAAGKITASATGVQMAALATGRYGYQLQIISGGVVITVCQGQFWITPDLCRQS